MRNPRSMISLAAVNLPGLSKFRKLLNPGCFNMFTVKIGLVWIFSPSKYLTSSILEKGAVFLIVRGNANHCVDTCFSSPGRMKKDSNFFEKFESFFILPGEEKHL